MQNQMYPQNPIDDSNIPDYLRTSSIQARPSAADQNSQNDPNAAANLIRQKIASIYTHEPDAHAEAQEVAAMYTPLSRHQEYMRSLQTSGKSWAEIQNAWHAYYQGLNDTGKHEVWQEFYSANRTATPFQQHVYQQDQAQSTPAASVVQQPDRPLPQAFQYPQSAQPTWQPNISAPQQSHQALPASHIPQANTFQPAIIPADYTAKEPIHIPAEKAKPNLSSVADIKEKIRSTVSTNSKLKKSDHFKSLAFGLATGAVVVFFFLFGFFNEVFITPFIQPSRVANETPIIVNTASAPVSATPKVIIPKINVEIPVDYSQTTIEESAIEAALDKGVVHYPTTVLPGQAGNAAYFGHSSNNIFNPGKYKFAFVLLHKLVEGDTFYLTNDGKTYAYQVISRKVVDPSEVGVLGPVPNETATATLITCDPPGTSLKRLVIVGRQISPDPSGNSAPAAANPVVADAGVSANLPGNGPTLWSRMWHSIF